MGRYLEAKCKLCRRADMKLFLKGTRCITEKCAFAKRPTPPGASQNRRRSKPSYYALQLREKQKVKHYYGVLERQFRRYFKRAERAKGNTGEVLMSLLERRLDNVVHRLGLGLSRAQARLFVSHGHVTVNGRRVDVPSYQTRPGDVIRVKESAKSIQLGQANLAQVGREVPDFLSLVEGPPVEGHVLRSPELADVSIPVQTQLIVELCSK